MNGHTPGPWVVTSADWPDDEEGIVRYYVRHEPAEISFPNARLIAAAPELLDAAKNLRAAQVAYMHERNHGKGGPMIHAERLDRLGAVVAEAAYALDIAIAKAEGR
jgi:hypothetical protein